MNTSDAQPIPGARRFRRRTWVAVATMAVAATFPIWSPRAAAQTWQSEGFDLPMPESTGLPPADAELADAAGEMAASAEEITSLGRRYFGWLGIGQAAEVAGPKTVEVPFALAPTTQPASEPTTRRAPMNDKAEEAFFVGGEAVEDGQVTIMMGDSAVLRASNAVRRVSVAEPGVADVTPLDPTTLLLAAKRSGNTRVIVWDEMDNQRVLQVQVENDLRSVQRQLDRLLPGERIEAVDLNGRIALEGTVRSVETAQKAEAIARSYGEVANFLKIAGGQQVMLQIRFAEVSRSTVKQFGVNFGFADGTGSGASTIGDVNPIFPGEANVNGSIGVPTDSIGPNVTLFGGGVIGSTAFEVFVSALRDNNLLRVLAEPNLVATSGETGEFLAGGEYPIPVPSEEGIAIEYREFGVRLSYLPVVMGDGRIRLRLSPEVSDLDYSSGVSILGTIVPGLRKRALTTTIELADGQTFAVAGLLDSSVAARKEAVPLLGDVPIFGSLFRSVRYQRRETELVVLVTPRLVSPLNPDEVPALPGANWKHPNDGQLFLDGELGGTGATTAPAEASATPPTTPVGPPPVEASYRFTPAEPSVRRREK